MRARPGKILFVTDNGINESLALAEVSACLIEKGFETALLIERSEKNILYSIARETPDALVVPADNGNAEWAAAMTARLRAQFPMPIVLAGMRVTLHPDFLAATHANVACRGECDEALPELLSRLCAGEEYRDVRNCIFLDGGKAVTNPLRPLVKELDALPLPDRRIYYRYGYLKNCSTKCFATGRGIPQNIPDLRRVDEDAGGLAVRRKTPERVIEEIRDMERAAPIDAIDFVDGLFATDAAWMEKFRGLYGGGIRYPFSVRAAAGDLDEKKLRLLAGMGCHGIHLDAEPGDGSTPAIAGLMRRLGMKVYLRKINEFREHGSGNTSMAARPAPFWKRWFGTLKILAHWKRVHKINWLAGLWLYQATGGPAKRTKTADQFIP